MKYCYYCMNEISDNMDKCNICGHDPSMYESAPHILKPGTILNNKYITGVKIGEGGFGITYVGKDTILDIKVAIKEYYLSGVVNRNVYVSNDVNSNPSEKEKNVFLKGKKDFLHEARVLAKLLDEPGIVDVRDFFEENNTVYLIMEYIDGVSLKDYLKKRGVMPFSVAVELLLPAMRSLVMVHKHNLLHRDISPGNVMVSGNSVKLIDFGAARNYDDDKSHTAVLKHGYAPIEQYSPHGNQGPWTDIYALCALMYKCITGKTPHDSIDRLQNDNMKKPSHLGISINPDIENIIMKGLSVHYEDRYQSVEELIDALEEGSETTVVDESEQVISNNGNKVRKNGNKRVIIISVLAAIFVLCVVVFINSRNSKLPQEQNTDISSSFDIEKYSEDIILSLDKTQLSMKEGETEKLTIKASQGSVSNDSVIWSSDDTEVAVVNNGEVIALREGTATITAKTSDGQTASCEIAVAQIVPVSITLDKTSMTVKKGDSFELTASVMPENAKDKFLSWTSSDSSVAKVENGLVTAISEGKAEITANTSNGVKASCYVKVEAVKPSDIKLSKSKLNLYIGDTETIKADVIAESNNDLSLTWTSSDPTVVSVSDGIITAINSGTATITAKTVDGSTSSCKVNVKTPKISFRSKSEELFFGDSINAYYDLEPGEQEVILTSSDTSIAQVEGNTITALGNAGSCTVMATMFYGGKLYSDSMLISVNSISINLKKTAIDLSREVLSLNYMKDTGNIEFDYGYPGWTLNGAVNSDISWKVVRGSGYMDGARLHITQPGTVLVRGTITRNGYSASAEYTVNLTLYWNAHPKSGNDAILLSSPNGEKIGTIPVGTYLEFTETTTATIDGKLKICGRTSYGGKSGWVAFGEFI